MNRQAPLSSGRSRLRAVWELGSCLTVASKLIMSPAIAQSISIDGSTSTLLNGSNQCATGDCAITGGLRDGSGAGPNLFHSFENFNVDNGSTVTFSDPGVDNIVSRVTGSSLSNINGTLKVDGSANLFLLNANGIMFGENVSLDIQGSFFASTAESLLFSGNAQFGSLSQATPSLLNVNVPLGLQFGSSPRPIEVKGNGHNITYNAFDSTLIRETPTAGLSLPAGQTLALLGGDVIVQGGHLTAESGHIELGALGNRALVQVTDHSSGWTFDYTEADSYQNILLSQSAALDVSGDDAGSIHLRGGQISFREGSLAYAQTALNGGGQIAFNASAGIDLIGVDLSPSAPGSPLPTIGTPTGLVVEIAPGAFGNGSSQIAVNTPQLSLTAGAQVGLGMGGEGTSGAVNINAPNITLDNGSNVGPSLIYTAVLPVFGPPPGASGQGGDLKIQTEQLTLTNGAQIVANTFGAGNAGNLTIDATDIVVQGQNAGGNSAIVSSSEVPPIPPLPNGSGNGGELTIRTERLLLAEVGQISVSTGSNNSAGNLTIEASESIEIRDGDEQGRSGLFASALEGSGAGGNIQLNTRDLRVSKGATINVGNFPSFSSSMSNPGTGSAGNIDVVASDIVIEDSGFITADTVSGDRANITLRSESIVLRTGSRLSTNATGSATGGNINLNTETLVALENSDITANAVNNFGGRVIVEARTVLGTDFREQLTLESDITATSNLGSDFSGTVEIRTPQIDPTKGIIELPEGLSPEKQIVAACEQLDSNTFIATGRGGLPEDASQLITGESIWNDFRLLENVNGFPAIKDALLDSSQMSIQSFAEPDNHSVLSTAPTIVEAQTWFTNDHGKVVLGAHTATPVAANPSANCLAST